MSEVLIFAGTSEGRVLTQILAGSEIPCCVCVATEYGSRVLKEQEELSGIRILTGRLDREQMQTLMAAGFSAVVDATHPFAVEVSDNIKAAAQAAGIPLLRLLRPQAGGKRDGIVFADAAEAARALGKTRGNILLTTGSKDLQVYAADPQLRPRLFVRVLPREDSLRSCLEAGLSGRQIIAMQGPFSEEMDLAVIRQFDIAHVVSKQSGRAGGFFQKMNAAARAGAAFYIIGRPAQEGLSLDQVLEGLGLILGQQIKDSRQLQITLAGAGMGPPENMTLEAAKALQEADLLLGAPRLLEGRDGRVGKKALYLPQDVIPFLQQARRENPFIRRVLILFSGDASFYSGCGKMYTALQAAAEDGSLPCRVRVLPGISSLACLAARLGISYDDAAVMSIHGRKDDPLWKAQLADLARSHEKTFLLAGSDRDIKEVRDLLVKSGLGDCRMTAGCRLGSPDEKILDISGEEAEYFSEAGPILLLITNERPRARLLAADFPDSAFIRGPVPMTKREVRQLILARLRLRDHMCLWDIGSGTGSIAVQAAALSPSLRVIALERKEAALDLIRQNREKFQVWNLQIAAADLPDLPAGLPVPDAAFIGGSGGKLEAVLRLLYSLNPHMRVVVSAVTVQTLTALTGLRAKFPLKEFEMVSLQIARGRRLGAYDALQAENPVWLCSFNFSSEEEK